MDVAVFQKNSSKISWLENLNVELLNGTLCWYVIFEREAREFQSFHSIMFPLRHSNTNALEPRHGQEISSDVGRVRVGEQGSCKHKFYGYRQVLETRHGDYEHELSHTHGGL